MLVLTNAKQASGMPEPKRLVFQDSTIILYYSYTCKLNWTIRARHPENHRNHRTSAKISRHFKTFQDISRHVKTFQDMSRHFKTFQNISRHFKTFQDISRQQNRMSSKMSSPQWNHVKLQCQSVLVSHVLLISDQLHVLMLQSLLRLNLELMCSCQHSLVPFSRV